MRATAGRHRRGQGWHRRLAPALVLAVAGAALACSEPPTTGGGEVVSGAHDLPECPLDALDEAAGPVEITLWYGGIAGTTQDTMEEMVRRFNESQDQVRLTAANQGVSYDEVFRKYESAASASTTEQLPDIVLLEDTQLPVMIDGGQVLPAQSCMEADGYDMSQIMPVVRSTYTVNGVLWPGYANVSTSILYYNKAHWARAGLDPEDPPETLEEVYEQARALKDAGVSDRPFALKLNQNYFKNWLNGVGVEMVNEGNGRDGEPTEATFDTPEARELLELLRRMQEEGLVNLYSDTEGGIDHFLALVNQQSSMLVETSTASTTIADALSGQITAEDAGVDLDESGLDLSALVPGTAPYPGIEEPGQVIPGGGAFFMLGTSEPAQQAASWRFLRFMLEPENVREWHVNGGYLPITTEAADDPAIREFQQDDLGGLLLRTGVEQLAEADAEQPGPLIGPYVDFATSVERALDAVLLDGADIDSSLGRAEDQVTDALEQYAGSG